MWPDWFTLAWASAAVVGIIVLRIAFRDEYLDHPEARYAFDGWDEEDKQEDEDEDEQ